jgi:hypothetical protein
MPGAGGDGLLPTIVSQSYGKPLNPIIVPVGTTFDLYFWGIVTPTHEGEYILGFDWYSGSYFDADPYANPLGSGNVSMVNYPGGVYDPDPPISTPLYYNDYTGSIITLSASAVNGDTYVYWMRLSQSMLPSATLDGGYAYGQDVYVTFTGSVPTGSVPTGSVPTGSVPTGSTPSDPIPPRGSWRGDPTNPVPNPVREPTSRSEKPIGDNRALHIRRDTDGQKNITIGLYDIDEAIMTQLERINLQVTDNGQIIKVPVFYGSPEIWTAARRDGYIRDKQGKIILPLITLKRTNSGDDESLKYFNRYLHSAVMKKYSTNNKYTQFSILSGQNAPVNEVYNVVFPSHMKLTYHFIIWTEYIEQMNHLVEELRYNTGDYWGSKKGFKFRTKVDGFSHTTELQVGEDRVVKTDFDLMTHGYILPETITTLENQKSTMEKFFTPKKIIINSETVSTNFDLTQFDSTREKWRNPNYPNLPKDEEIPAPPINVVDGMDNNSIASAIVSSLNSITTSPTQTIISDSIPNSHPYLKIVPPPPNVGGNGYDGYVAYDAEYFYVYAGGQWRRVAISQFQ